MNELIVKARVNKTVTHVYFFVVYLELTMINNIL